MNILETTGQNTHFLLTYSWNHVCLYVFGDGKKEQGLENSHLKSPTDVL